MENGAKVTGWPESYKQVTLPTNWNLSTSRWKHLPRFFLAWHVRAELCARTTGCSQLVRSHASSVPCSHRRPPSRALTRSCPFPPACCHSPRLRQHGTGPHCLSVPHVSGDPAHILLLQGAFHAHPRSSLWPHLVLQEALHSLWGLHTPCLFLVGLWLTSHRAA